MSHLLHDLKPLAAVARESHGLLEAPRLTGSGSVLYSDVTGGGVWRIDADGTRVAVLPKRRGIGGMLLHADGGIVVSGRTLVHLAPDGTQRTLYEREDITGFNDLGAASDGSLLAGALRYHPFAGEAEAPGALLRLDAAGEARVLNDDIVWPNGIGVSPDGERIYISDYARALVLTLAITGGEA